MIAHEFEPQAFYPTDLHSAFDGMSFSPVNTLLAEASERTRQKAREMAKTAMDYHAATLSGVRQPPEREVIEFINRMADSLLVGTEALNPFSAEVRKWVVTTMGVSEEWTTSWERICQGLIQAAGRELELGDFVLWQRRIQEIVRCLRRIRAALRIEPRAAEIATQAARAMQSYADKRGGQPGIQVAASFESAVLLLINHWMRLLRYGSEAEIHLNLCRLWAEQFAPRAEMSVPAWQFFIATLDLQVRESTGPGLHRAVSPYLETLHHASPRFAFCGELYRHLPEVETVLEPLATGLPFKWQELVQEIVGEIVWAAAPGYPSSPMAARLLSGVDALSGTTPAEFREFTLNLINASRPLCERSWLDWLEAALGEVHNALENALGQTENADAIRKLLETAAENLREGREAFAGHQHLVTDLQALFEAALRSSQLFRDVSHARRHFRCWFVETLMLRRPAEFWRHTQTMTRALTTCVRQAAQANRFLAGRLPALELLGELVTVSSTGEWLLRAWSEICKVEVDAEGGSCQRDVQWVLRVTALDLVRSGSFRAPAEVCRWVLEEVAPFVPSVPGERFEQTYREACESVVRSTGALADASLISVLGKVADSMPAVLASHRLWMNSEGLGNEIARRVYAELPEYAQATGIGGAASCARDNALTLRRVALALTPGLENAADYIADWWGNLVNIYVVNRPPGLFRANCEAMLAVCAEHLTPRQSTLVENLIRPVFEGASTDDELTRKLPKFQQIPWSLPLLAEVSALPEFGWELERQRAAHFFQSGEEMAVAYASRREHPALAAIPHLLPKVNGRLAAGFPAYRWAGTLDAPTAAAWREALETMPGVHEVSERLIHGWMQHTGSIPELTMAIPLVGYLQELLEFNRQCAAGIALRREAGNLGRLVAKAIHACLPTQLAHDVSRVKPERCSEDLTLLFRSMGEGMASLPRAAALLHVERMLAEQIAPHVRYGEAVWRMVWMLAAQECASLFSADLQAELECWFRRFEGIGRALPFLGRLNHRLLLNDESQFSSDPQEEWEWRRTVSTLLVLHRLHPPGDADASLLAGALCASLPLLQGEDFGERLEAIADAFKVWFVDIEVSDIASGMIQFKARWDAWRQLAAMASQVQGIGVRLASRLPFLNSGVASISGFSTALNWFSMQTAIAAVEGGWRPPGNRWGLPAPLRIAHGALAPLFPGLEKESIQAWGTAFGNAFASLGIPAANVQSALLSATTVLGGYESLASVWAEPWGSSSDQTTSCSRDLNWLARRLGVNGLAGTRVNAPGGAGDWYLREVLPHAGTIQADTYLASIQSLSMVAEGRSLSPSIACAFVDFQSHLPRLLAAHQIEAAASPLAAAAFDFLQERHPAYSDQLTPAHRAACQRDCTLTLRAAARAVAADTPETSSRLWFHRAVATYLSEREKPILPICREMLAEAVHAVLDPEVACLAEEELFDIPNERAPFASLLHSAELQTGKLVTQFAGFLDKASPPALLYASETTGSRPLSVLGVLNHLASEFPYFAWHHALSPALCAVWRSLLASGAPADSFARYLNGLIQQCDALPALNALQFASYIQELLDFHRQCSAGIALSACAVELAAEVAGELHRSIPNQVWTPGHPATPEAGTRDFTCLFASMGRAMSASPRETAQLRIGRTLAEELSASTHYTPAAWRMVWMLASQASEHRLSAEHWREFSRWCRQWEKSAPLMPAMGAIARQLADPSRNQMGASPEEDYAVRRSLLLVAASAFPPLTHTHGTAPAGLPDAWKRLRADIIDCDLAPFDSAFSRWSRASISADQLRACMRGLAPWLGTLGARNPLTRQLHDLGLDSIRVILHSIHCAHKGAVPSNAWGLPSSASLASRAVLLAIGQAGESSAQQFAGQLAHFVSPHGPESQAALESLWKSLAVLGQELPSFESRWSRAWSITLPPPRRSIFSFGSRKAGKPASEHASCGRDLKWAAKRFAADTWSSSPLGLPPGESTARWFAGEVVPYASSVAGEEWESAAMAIEQAITQAEASSPKAQSPASFRAALPCHLAAASVARMESELAAQVGNAVFTQNPRYAQQLTDADRRACVRDTRLTLRQLALGLADPAEASSFNAWWNETVGNHLKPKSREIFTEYRQAMDRALQKALPREQYARMAAAVALIGK